jgi:hypothetical protein
VCFALVDLGKKAELFWQEEREMRKAASISNVTKPLT